MVDAKPLPGTFAPWFKARALSGLPNYSFDTVAGRHVVMLFFGSAQVGPCRAALELVARRRAMAGTCAPACDRGGSGPRNKDEGPERLRLSGMGVSKVGRSSVH